MATEQDPFAAMGGGVRKANGDWVPRDHPDAVGLTTPGAPPGAGGPSQPGTSAPAITQQANNAATYSQAPGAAPTSNTANQGTQDVVRNSYLAQATQGTTVNRNDPNFRQQADAFSAGVERQRRNYVSDQAENLGPTATGALRGQERMASERAGQAVGGFEAELVGRELQNRRAEIQQALAALGATISDDQRRALELQLAELNAATSRLGISTSASEGGLDRALRERLAQMTSDLDWARLRQQGDQWADNFGLTVADTERSWNDPSAYF